MKKKVLIIDDSILTQKYLSEIINSFSEFTVVGVADNPKIGSEKIQELNPDIITLDIEMPIMDGLTFLEKLMRLRPMPVIMISGHTEKDSPAYNRALELGASDCIKKPSGSLESIKAELYQKLLSATGAKKSEVATLPTSAQVNNIIAIGASTGGAVALTKIFSNLDNTLPGIVIVQHMPPAFTKSFAERLNAESSIVVVEAQHGDIVRPGHAYLAPGGKQAEILYSPEGYILQIREAPPVDRHCPSVNVLFSSVAKHAKKNAMGIILTGNG